MEAQFKQVVQQVINKAWEDDAYRASLVNAPKSAIKSLTGVDIPAGVNLVFADQTDASVQYVNLPPKPDFDNMELSDEQLELVAGGEVIVVAILGLIGAVAGAAGGVASSGIKAGW